MSERDQMSESKMQNIFDQFVRINMKKNSKLKTFMKKYGLEFDFDQILISRLLAPLQASNLLLSKLNSILLK